VLGASWNKSNSFSATHRYKPLSATSDVVKTSGMR
jgi:hypothetical protein